MTTSLLKQVLEDFLTRARQGDGAELAREFMPVLLAPEEEAPPPSD
jgi:hypothetical protein